MSVENGCSSTRTTGWVARIGLGVFSLAFMIGCSLSTDLGRPKRARIDLQGPASSDMEMIVSTNFLVVESNVSFVDADTTQFNPPLERTYDLGVPARIYFKAVNVGDQAETFALKVWIGDEIWYNESKLLAPEEAFEFVYRYSEPAIY